MFGFSEQNQYGYLDSADESVHTVPRACNSSLDEANEDEHDPWGDSAVNPSLRDDDSGIVASNTVREIVLMCLHIPSTNIISRCLKNTANREYSIYTNCIFKYCKDSSISRTRV